MMDIIIPDQEPKKFTKLLHQLDIKSPLWFYPIKQAIELSKEKQSIGCVVSNAEHVKRAQKKEIPTLSLGNLRPVIEAGPDFVSEVEQFAHKDGMHQRNSGLNDVLCKIMKQKNTTYLFSFSLLLSTTGEKRAKILGRMSQNLMLLKKYNVKHSFCSCARTPYELRSQKTLAKLLSFVSNI